MEAEIGAQVIPCATPEEAARGADILAACTNSVVPIVFARMLEPGMHLTQVSGELDLDVLPRLDVAIGGDPPSQIYQGIPVDDSHGFTTYLAGNLEALQEAIAGGRQPRPTDSFRGRAAPLVDLIAGTVQGRLRDDEISASNGAVRGGGKQGLQFVTVASLVYDRAKQAGLGREIPTDWFLQDIRD
jgi:alanine dehydrogenase